MAPKKRKNGVEDGEDSNKRAKRAGKSDSDSEPSDSGDEQQIEEIDASASNNSSPILEGDKFTGQLLICGSTNWELTGRKQLPKGVKAGSGRNLWGPHRMGGLKDVCIRTIVSGCMACHSALITTEGKVYTFGRNESGQLGVGDILGRDAATLVSGLSGINVVFVACGRAHTLFLTDHGKVYGCGANASGQLGIGNQTATVNSPTPLQYGGPAIKLIRCGADFSAVADVTGNAYTFGNPEYGQLGHNTDGKYFVSSSKLGFSCETRPRRLMVFIDRARDNTLNPVTDVEVVDIACGQNHIVILDKKERVFTWGFGAYGRLGHGDNKDEMVPRLLKFFDGPNRGAVKIAAGSTFTMAVNKAGALFVWGQTKKTGEAAMYPKPVNDLSGWKINLIGCCNKSIVLQADKSIVTWGAHPTYGELGYGEGAMKTSSIPEEAKPFSGLHVHQVACGSGHSMFLVRDDTDEDKEKLKALPEFNP